MSEYYIKKRVEFDRTLHEADVKLKDTPAALYGEARANTQAGDGGGASFGGRGRGLRDRNVYDLRNYKIADLTKEPPLAAFKKRRHDVDLFIAIVGSSWNCVSSRLRCSGIVEEESTQGSSSKVLDIANKIEGKSAVNE